jgi:hypothetical protein
MLDHILFQILRSSLDALRVADGFPSVNDK